MDNKIKDLPGRVEGRRSTEGGDAIALPILGVQWTARAGPQPGSKPCFQPTVAHSSASKCESV